MNGAVFALIALVPLVAGTGPQESSSESITAALCNGGEITLDLGGKDDGEQRDCHPKGCHAGTCREKGKVKQPRPT